MLALNIATMPSNALHDAFKGGMEAEAEQLHLMHESPAFLIRLLFAISEYIISLI